MYVAKCSKLVNIFVENCAVIFLFIPQEIVIYAKAKACFILNQISNLQVCTEIKFSAFSAIVIIVGSVPADAYRRMNLK